MENELLCEFFYGSERKARDERKKRGVFNDDIFTFD